MRVHADTLRQRVRNQDLLVFGGIVDSRSGAAVEMYHDAGYDVLLLDREHTALSSETILEHIRVARALALPVMVRVAEDSYHELNRTLDQGPDGIFVPRIRSRAQVEEVVRTVSYPPRGVRGVAGSTCPAGKYAGWGSLPEQIATISENLVIGIQIETREAMEQLGDVLSVPGVDMAVIGCDDLTVALGAPGDVTSAAFRDAGEQVIAACRRHGVLPGIALGDPRLAADWVARGMRVLWYASDITLMWSAAVQQLQRLREQMGPAPAAGGKA